MSDTNIVRAGVVQENNIVQTSVSSPTRTNSGTINTNNPTGAGIGNTFAYYFGNLSIGTVTSGEEASATITGNAPNQTLNLVLPKGDTGSQGIQGVQGVGIADISLTSSDDLIDTYTVTYEDGNTSTFTVTNGEKGDTGNDGISPTIEATPTLTGVDITITDVNGTSTVSLTNGSDAEVTSANIISALGYTPYSSENPNGYQANVIEGIQSNGTDLTVSNKVVNIPAASGDGYGVTKLSNSLVSTSNTSALTPNAINTFAREIVTGVSLFDKTATYAVGDRVRYSSGYYECNTAITSGHAWNSNEWTQITIQEQIDEKLDDVMVNGNSIVTDNVAVIPIAQQSGSYGLIKLGSGGSGLLVASSGNLAISMATNTNIDEKISDYKPIVPSNLDYAVKVGVTANANTLSAAEKTAALSWLGAQASGTYVNDVTIEGTSIVSSGVAAIPIAQAQGDYGLVKLSSDATGIMLSSSGTLQTRRATDSDIATRTQINRPIVPANLDLAVKTSITSNTITLTTAEKTSACSWLGASQGIIKRVWTNT